MQASPHILCVLNPTAGSGIALQRWPKIVALLESFQISYELLAAQDMPPDLQVSRRLEQNGPRSYAAIAGIGGDGTHSAVINGLMRYRAAHAPGASLQVFGTAFDGSVEQWTPLGTFAGGGDGWLSAELDIAQALSRTNPSLDLHRIFLSVVVPTDGALLIDDYAMYSPAATQAGFRWAAPASPSGISGYSWVLDSSDATVPPEKLCGSTLQADFTGLKPGRHVFHLRARDGAGNWGPTSSVPFQLTAPPDRK